MEAPKKAHDGLYGLFSKWPIALDLAGSNLPCRLEGEIADLVVLGEIPKEISGTFYRVMVDPFVPPDERNVPIDGDGNISAFRFHEGRVGMKMRYIETERYKLERKAGRALFGLYRNPFTHHPCVRAAVDSTANTNLIYWAGQLLALKEVALPYALDPDTLDTDAQEALHSMVGQMGSIVAWEIDGRIYAESSRVHDNAFPFSPPEDGRMPSPETKADFVRWEFDLSRPTGTIISDPVVILDLPSEFPRIDERFLTTKHEWVFVNVFIPENSDGSKNIFQGLNGLAMHSNYTGETRYFYAGDKALCQEPIFVPRSEAEADGWVMTLIERKAENRCDIAIIDTRNFAKPVAIVQLPFHVKAQIHGNWVPGSVLNKKKSLVRQYEGVDVSGKGALEPIVSSKCPRLLLSLVELFCVFASIVFSLSRQ